jgi:energy-coupling factor transport system permease protein
MTLISDDRRATLQELSGDRSVVRQSGMPAWFGRRGVGAHAMPRWLHPGAWWMWALGLGVTASRTTNPILLGAIITVAWLVVKLRRPSAAWGRAFEAFLVLGLIVIAFRVFLGIIVGDPYGHNVLVTLPQVPLPHFMAGVHLGGRITLEALLASFYDGLRLATVLIVVGAANALASPTRLLKAVPSALYEAGVALIVALTFAPQLISDAERVRTARRLRGRSYKGIRGLAGGALPIVGGALDRAVGLAAAMDSRGYGRSVHRSRSQRMTSSGLLLLGLVGLAIGLYGLTDGSAPSALGWPLLIIGIGTASAGLFVAGRRVSVTRYRRERWQSAEFLVAFTGWFGVVACALVSNPALLTPSTAPPAWPTPSWLVLGGIVLALLAGVIAPLPPDRDAANTRLGAQR